MTSQPQEKISDYAVIPRYHAVIGDRVDEALRATRHDTVAHSIEIRHFIANSALINIDFISIYL